MIYSSWFTNYGTKQFFSIVYDINGNFLLTNKTFFGVDEMPSWENFHEFLFSLFSCCFISENKNVLGKNHAFSSSWKILLLLFFFFFHIIHCILATHQDDLKAFLCSPKNLFTIFHFIEIKIDHFIKPQ